LGLANKNEPAHFVFRSACAIFAAGKGLAAVQAMANNCFFREINIVKILRIG
jgi:hypothetical protein